jgi:predicted MFS family arabinose efflux permease
MSSLVATPLKQPAFRTLWAGMGLSYAGDRLQELAQGWLMATLTNSAMAVGGISILSALPMLLMPLGGAIADQVDRRRLVMVGQLCGALVTAMLGLLVFSNWIAPWHIYVWALISGLVWMLIRPAYKVLLTEVVEPGQVRQAVGINSITETTAIVLISAGGSLLIGAVGLTVAFVFNSFSYLVAIACLWSLRTFGRFTLHSKNRFSPGRVLTDLKAGILYLGRQKDLLYPLLVTFVFITAVSPITALLAAIVHARGGSVVELGMLGAGGSLGALIGAGVAGARSEGNPLRTYAVFGILAAGMMALFIFFPSGWVGLGALAAIGFLAFSQAVWNTSRVPRLAETPYQARLQAITTMAFTLGGAFGSGWGGLVVDRFGIFGLLGGAAVLAAASLGLLVLAFISAH